MVAFLGKDGMLAAFAVAAGAASLGERDLARSNDGRGGTAAVVDDDDADAG